MRRIVGILNPQADRGRTARIAESVRQAVRGRLEMTVLGTTRRGEAVEMAHEAAGQGYDAVVAIGGDGTVHEVANGLMAAPSESRPPLGVIPAGSGNDFAYAAGIAGDLESCVDTLERGAPRAVDVGLVRASGGAARYIVNNIGMLLDGEVNLASHRFRWPRGSALYLRAVMQTLLRRPAVAQLQLSFDETTLHREAMVLSIGSGPRSGGRFFLVPAAAIDDGRFDYMLVGPMSRSRLIWELFHAGDSERQPDRRIERGQFRSLTLRSSIPIAAHADGEPWLKPEDGVREVEISVLAGALKVLSTPSVLS